MSIPGLVSAYPGGSTTSSPRVKPFALDEATISQLQDMMAGGKATSVTLVKKYLHRIEEIDRRGPCLNAVIELNPDAPAIAAGLDEERLAGLVTRNGLIGTTVL